MAIKKDIKKLNTLFEKALALIEEGDLDGAREKAEEYNDLLGWLLVFHGEKKLMKRGAKLPTWLTDKD